MELPNSQKNARGQCQIVWFKWTDRFANSEDTTVLSRSSAFDITNHVEETVLFTKNIGEAAGQFSFKLAPTRDWQAEGMEGSWCLIYMANDGALTISEEPTDGSLPKISKNSLIPEKIRGICYIERASPSTETEENGNVDVQFNVTGRDYGIVYEGTDLWFNYFKFEETQITALTERIDNSQANTVADLISVSHDLFYAPQKVIKSQTKESVELGEVGTQWLLPRTMLDFLGAEHEGPSFYGNITDLKNFGKTRTRIPIVNPLDYVNGIAWDRLKEFSLPELHEFFPEISNEGKPQLIFRTIPWGLDSTGYPRLRGNIGQDIMYKTLTENPESRVDIAAIDNITTDLGKDDHNRYNHFFTTAQTSLNVPQSNIEILQNRTSKTGKKYPHIQKGSVRRHGLRKMHTNLNTFATSTEQTGAENANGQPDANLLVEYNEFQFDLWNNAVFFDTGSAVIHGNNDIRVGKVIVYGDDVVYHANKVFYIEEYTDEFVIDEKGVGDWNQTLQLTRGIELADLDNVRGVARRTRPFVKKGTLVKDK